MNRERESDGHGKRPRLKWRRVLGYLSIAIAQIVYLLLIWIFFGQGIRETLAGDNQPSAEVHSSSEAEFHNP